MRKELWFGFTVMALIVIPVIVLTPWSHFADAHLSRADLGVLVEAETDWHRNAGQHTAPMPRITADMTAPPSVGKQSRAWVETLFA